MFYTTQHAHRFEAPDLEFAESRARMVTAQAGPLSKLLCVREMGAEGPPQEIPNPERREKIKRGRIKPPEF